MVRPVAVLSCALLTAFLLFGDGAAVSIPPNLKAEGIPPIQQSLMDSIQRYSETRAASLQDWHPVKRQILISTRFANVPQIHLVGMPGGARTQLTFFSDPPRNAAWRPVSGEVFLFSLDAGGGEFFQYHLYDLATGGVTLLTDGKSRNTFAQWSNDGRKLVHSSTRRNGRDADLYVGDPSQPGSTRLLMQVEGGGWAAMDWSPDDRKLLVVHHRSIVDSSLYLVDVATGSRELLTPGAQKTSYSHAMFSRDGKSLYLATDRDSEFRRLAQMDLATGGLTFLRLEIHWDIDALALSRDGRRLAYVINEEGSSTLRVLDTRTLHDLPLPKLSYGQISGLRWHDNSREIGFTFASARSPSDVCSIDVEKGTLERWTASETGGLNTDNLSEPEMVRWKSFDGLPVSGFLYKPPAIFRGPRPVIISIHGGPESQFKPGFLGRNNYYLNELGIALIYPNVRGSSGYGKTFLALDNGLKREDAVRDIGALLDWIETREDLDSSRIMVTGGSYGGYMTLASMTHYNDRFRCAVNVVGISNFVTFLENTESYRRDLRRVEYGDERDPQMRAFLHNISPLTNAHKITRPVFIVQGRNDPRVPASESEQMVAAIRDNKAPVWYLLAEDEGHGFAKKGNQDIQFAATILFVREHLLGGQAHEQRLDRRSIQPLPTGSGNVARVEPDGRGR